VRDVPPAAGFVDHVDAVVLAISPRNAEEEREPAPEAEPALVREAPFEDELAPIAAKVLPGLLPDPVHVDLELVTEAGRQLNVRPRRHAS